MADQTGNVGNVGNGGNGSVKKAIADMSQEELIEKCKGLIQIAQKAKAAKDGELSRN
jgi:hypothetical protein